MHAEGLENYRKVLNRRLTASEMHLRKMNPVAFVWDVL